MEALVAKSAGFCFGVKRAVDTVYKEVEKGGRIYTYGPIIHNEQVVKDLEDKGVHILESIEDLDDVQRGTIVIRSHGVSKKVYDAISDKGFVIIDATCPFVKKIHNIVHNASNEGAQVVVIGNINHPEVMGIVGWCNSNKPAIVIENKQEAIDFSVSNDEKICVVSQTTFNLNKFQELVEILMKKGYSVNVVNTICNATEERQKEAKNIASEVDAMIVIGGSKSSNSQKLYEICSRECENTQFVQTIEDLNPDRIRAGLRVGITAGASTPKNIIEEVQNYVRINF